MKAPLDLLIGKTWRPGSGPVRQSFHPGNGALVAEWQEPSVREVEEAIVEADQAWRQASWAGLMPHERAGVLFRVAQLIRARHEELAQLQTLDNGKPIMETRALVASAAGTFQFFGSALETLEDEILPARGPHLAMSLHEPLGVVAAITPWNSPVASEAQKLAPALAAGNAVILKPSENTPLLALELGRLCLEAGVPPGVISVLPGGGSPVGETLVTHPLVKKVAFTGGTTTGARIAQLAAPKFMPLSLELGGKSPTIVFSDADLDQAIAGVLFGIYSSSGESCIAGSRLFVERPLFEPFVARLQAAIQHLRMGDPFAETTQMGPLITPEHRQRVDAYVQLGLQEGGTLLCGGKAPEAPELAAGTFYEPTLLVGLGNQTRLAQEEVFGPVLMALPFDDEDDLIAQANDSVYGLAAGLWSPDYQKLLRVSRQLQCGTVWINTYKQFSIAVPFGGVKQSGLGREKGRASLRAYMNQKSLLWGLNDTPIPWALG